MSCLLLDVEDVGSCWLYFGLAMCLRVLLTPVVLEKEESIDAIAEVVVVGTVPCDDVVRMYDA